MKLLPHYLFLFSSADTFPFGSVTAGSFRWQRSLVDQSKIHVLASY